MASRVNIEEDVIVENAAQNTYHAIVDEETEDEDEDEDITWFREHIENTKKMKFYRRPSIYSVGIVNFFIFICMAATGPTLEIIMFKLSCNTLIDSEKNSTCDPIQTQLLVTNLSMYKEVGLTIIQLIPLAKIGELSDIYGRKPFIFITALFLTLSKILEYFIYKKYDTVHFYLLLIAYYISGLSGGGMVIMSLMNSYIADVVEANERIFALGLIGSSMYLGQSLGPALGSFILRLGDKLDKSKLDPSLHLNKITTQLSKISSNEFLLLRLEIIIYIIVCLYLGTMFPESRNEKARRKSRTNSINSSRQQITNEKVNLFNKYVNVFSPLKILTYPAELVSPLNKANVSKIRFVVLTIISTSCLYITMMIAISQVLVQYGILLFDWGTSELSVAVTIIAVSRCIVLIFVLPFLQTTVLQKWFKFKPLKTQFDMIDYTLIFIGYCVDLFVFMLFYFVKSSNGFMFGFGIFSLGAIVGPTTNSALLKFYPNSKVGVLFGANALLLNLISIIAPILVMNLYKFSLMVHWPNLIFLVYSVFLSLIICSVFMIKKVMKLNRETGEGCLTVE